MNAAAHSVTLLLDLDDTLIPSSRAYDLGMHAIGISTADAIFLQARADVKNACPPGYPAARSRTLYFKRYLELGPGFSPRRMLELTEGYQETVIKTIAAAWHEADRAALLKRLRLRFKKIGIVSNETVHMQALKLRAIDPDWELFDFIVISEELGAEKPDRKVFNRALDRAGHPAPRDCYFVGDNYEFDILGSINIGMNAIQSTEFVDEERHHDRLIRSLDELAMIPLT